MKSVTKKILSLSLACLFICNSGIKFLYAAPILDIYSKPEKVTPLVLGKFSYNKGSEIVSNELNDIIMGDLANSGLFVVRNDGAELSNIMHEGNTGGMGNIRDKGFSYVVTGKVISNNPNEYVINVKIWDSFSENIVLEKKYIAIPLAIRKLAHTIADAITLQTTGKQGFFNSKIMYVSGMKIGKQTIRRVAAIDQDGYNQKFLTPQYFGKEPAIVMTPSYCNKNNVIVYVSLVNKHSQVNLLDVATGKTVNLSSIFPFLQNRSVFSPNLSPNGQEIVVSITGEKGADLYKFNFKTLKWLQLTHGGINVSPSFSPNGDYLVYSSDIEGKQNLYIIDSNGWSSRRISSGSGAYHEPAWSPDGRKIVFTKMLDNVFHIGVISPAGGEEMIISSNYMSANPAWAPSGREVIFSRKKDPRDNTKLVIVSTTGKEHRVIRNNIENISDPFWALINE